jgi:hypothetical protein
MSEHDADKSDVRKDVTDIYAFLKDRDEDPVRNRHTDAEAHGPLDLSQFFFGGSDLRNVIELPNAVEEHLAPPKKNWDKSSGPCASASVCLFLTGSSSLSFRKA